MRSFSLIAFLCLTKLAFSQNIIPTPNSIKKSEGVFLLTDKAHILSTKEADYAVMLFKEVFLSNRKHKSANNSKQATIHFITDHTLSAESYRIDVNSKNIKIYAGEKVGFIYAVQSLKQIANRENNAITISCVSISDQPRVKWRSFLLDSGRQYHQVATIKKYIDMLSMLKMNYFHWHLTEGLGWRIEIKKYPKLANIGSFVGTGKEQQGYYTQKEIKDIVKYAEVKGVTIVPEIDMPGHSEAALHAYPEYSCFGAPIAIPKNGFTHNIFCGGKDNTHKFLKDILDEVCDLFPSTYIHLGGDEAPKNNWNKCPDCKNKIAEHNLKNSHDLQLWFMSEMAEYLREKGRKAIMWGDVVYEKGYSLPDNVVIQWWNWRGHGDLALRNAIEAGHPVICGTNIGTYLNFPFTPWKGYAANRTQSFKDIYTRNPSYITDNNPLILGMSCALWTDYELTEDMLDERLFPRILALSELMWKTGNLLSFESFNTRTSAKKLWFNNQGYWFNNN